MKPILKAVAIALFGLLTLAPVASARPARVVIWGGFGYPVWFGPYWGPTYIYSYPGPVAYTGELEIRAPMPGASIYVDGGFVGVTGKVKKIPLPAGTHKVQLRDPDGRTFYQQTVEIIAGGKTEIHPVDQPAPARQG
jgi:PEGA domain